MKDAFVDFVRSVNDCGERHEIIEKSIETPTPADELETGGDGMALAARGVEQDHNTEEEQKVVDQVPKGERDALVHELFERYDIDGDT